MIDESEERPTKKKQKYSAQKLCELLKERNKALIGRIVAYIDGKIIDQIYQEVDL